MYEILYGIKLDLSDLTYEATIIAINSGIAVKDNSTLCRPATKEEIEAMLKSMDANKAPRLSGLSRMFYKCYRQFTTKDVFKTIQCFLVHQSD